MASFDIPIKQYKVMNKTTSSLILAAGISAAPAFSQTMLFDFGPTTVTGADLTNSPGHEDGGLTGADTSWNLVQVTDISSGLVTSTGTASAVGINLGVESTSSSNIINFGSQPSSSSQLGTQLFSGVYSNTSVARDGIFNSFNSEPWAIGVKLDGLAAGEYNIYITARNTNTLTAQPTTVFGDAISNTDATFDYNSITGSSIANGTNSTSSGPYTGFEEGGNYGFLTITLSAGQSLALAISGDGAGNDGRGFLNSIEIVAVPEPSTYVTLMASLTLLGALAIRRKKQ
ncbi:PEP-CTERM sorting domain-containing protein [Cerasicoccus frondis]|uniref:PEP-CTERM sorting domain-containing protein n=1 Tax=Cerasicoccus frondis TaxID=490090 RepID=UPI00285265D0|nr:PEP-CTERM sorting domain-containing protein [Cerasicoccus frondis]